MTAPKNIEQENKPKPSLLPMDLLIKYLCPAYMEGLEKYYRESWRLGFKTSDMYDATIRHLEKYFYQKENWDPDANKFGVIKHHLGGALFSILCMLDTFENHPELDDRGKDWRKDKKITNNILSEKGLNANSMLFTDQEKVTNVNDLIQTKWNGEIK